MGKDDDASNVWFHDWVTGVTEELKYQRSMLDGSRERHNDCREDILRTVNDFKDEIRNQVSDIDKKMSVAIARATVMVSVIIGVVTFVANIMFRIITSKVLG